MTAREQLVAEARAQAIAEYAHDKVRDRYDADLMMAGFEDGVVWQAERDDKAAAPVEVTDTMVEKGCRAFYEGAQGITSWTRMSVVDPELADRYRDGIRAAIAAALKEMKP